MLMILIQLDFITKSILKHNQRNNDWQETNHLLYICAFFDKLIKKQAELKMPTQSNPFIPNYQPKYIYEFHINNPQNAKPQQPAYATATFEITLAKHVSTRTNPGCTQTCELELNLQGTIQSLAPMMPDYLEKNKEKIKKQWINNIANFLSAIQLDAASIINSDLNKSQATLTLPTQGYTSSVISLTSKSASITATTDNTSVSLSTDSPTIITFYFYNTALTVKNNFCQFSGNLLATLSITLTPQNPENQSLPILSESEITTIKEDTLMTVSAIISAIKIAEPIIAKARFIAP